MLKLWLVLLALVLSPWSGVTRGQRALPPCTTMLSGDRHYTSHTQEQRIWNVTLTIPISSFVSGWQMTLRFSRPLDVFTNYVTAASSGDNRQFVLRAPDDTLPAGSNLTLSFEAQYPATEKTLQLDSAYFNGRQLCNQSNDEVNEELFAVVFGTPRPSSPVSSLTTSTRRQLKYDYPLVLTNSILFYEAQRSGLLPLDNRIAWRNDSCLFDRGNRGEDLTGGYYTNGRTIKFTFPIAAAMTVLAWGIINHDAGYDQAGQLVLARDALNWGATWLVRCHTQAEELYALIGDIQYETQNFWGRPEDINFERPSFAINRTSPGSELAAEVAAALAASSVALREHYHNGPELSTLYLDHAKQLYEFAKNYRGDYSKAVPQVADYYRSWSGDEDELVWAALWLFRATGEQRYRNDAQDMYRLFKLKDRQVEDFSWDEKTLGVRVLLSQMTLQPEHEELMRRFCNEASNSRKHTPKGLFHTGRNFGTIRYASNVAFVCFEFGELLKSTGDERTNPYLEFAIRQVNYVLGDTGRSFMVGFGINPPKRIHHAASSCPTPPRTCNIGAYNSANPNPQVLIGAIVGGPDRQDHYNDTRPNYQQNDVAVDYNAGFQSLVAGLMVLHGKGELPAWSYVNR